MRLLLLAVACTLTCAPAQNIFVDATNGNDSNPGTPTAPVRSITAGIALASVGATVVILPGTYGPSATNESLPIGLGTTVAHTGITVRGIDSVVVDLAGSTNSAFEIGTLASGGRVTNLEFRNSDTAGWWTRVIETNGSPTNFEIDRCRFDGVNRGIVLWDSAPDVSGFSIHNNTFQNLANDAINEFEDTGPNRIFNNTIAGVIGGTNFVGILSDAQSSRIENNLIVAMRDGIARGGASSNLNFTANNVFNCAVPWAGSFSGAPPGNHSFAPQFVNRQGGDLRLQPSSPAIDLGVPSVPYRMDPDGNPGSIDSDQDGVRAPDIGAYELAVVRLQVTRDPVTGLVTTTVTGPTGFFGAALLAFGESVLRLPFGGLLVDPASLSPLPTPVAVLPSTFSATIGAPPGLSLVLQGIGLDATASRLYLANQAWLQF